MRVTGPVLAALLPLTAACYTYTRTPVTEVAVGAEVRARITQAHVDSLRELLGREERVLEGEVVESAPDGLMIAVAARETSDSPPAAVLRQRVAVPRDAIFELEVRRLDRLRTAGVVGGIALATTAVTIAAFEIADRLAGDDREGGTDLRIVLRRFRVPLGGGGP